MKYLLNFFQLFILTVIPFTAIAENDSEKKSDYVNQTLPQRWDYTENFSPEMPDNDSWWQTFNDPVLDSIIEIGVKNNYNLAIAARRINIARGQLRAVQSAYYPMVDLTAGWNKVRSSGLQVGSEGTASTLDYFSGSVSASWELDVFGKITSKARQSKELVKVSRAEYAGAMLSLCSEIATSYFQLRVWQAELVVAEEHSQNQQRIVKIAEARHEAGLASKLDVAQAREVYYSTMASIPVLKSSIEKAINSLSILLGDYPENIAPIFKDYRQLPDYHQIVGVGIPAELLRRRPDIIEAEKNIAASAAALGVAKKDFLPSLSINGSIGTAAHNFKDLFKNQSITYSIAPQLTWTLFSGFERSANVTIARETLRSQIDSYNQTIMTAVTEVNNSMSGYLSSLLHIDAIDLTLQQSNEALKLSVDLYKQGLTPFNNVVSAQLGALENQNSLVIAKGQALTTLVNIYRSLGGGWTGL